MVIFICWVRMWYYALVNDAYDVLIEDAVACISRFIFMYSRMLWFWHFRLRECLSCDRGPIIDKRIQLDHLERYNSGKDSQV